MLKRLKKGLLFFPAFFTVCVFLTTCGLEEYYYLPQVPESNIITSFNTAATISLPSIDDFYYAQYYKIYYRIYVSDINIESYETTINQTISPSLDGDYKSIYPNTDPTSTTAGTPANTLFTNRNYYELELYQTEINNILSTSGGSIKLSFPTERGGYPVISLNNGPEIRLYRSGKLISPEPDRFFRNSSDLSAPEKATANINADVAGRSGLSQRYSYVSMYIVAAGINPDAFTPIFSRPTHICVFKLPES